MKKLVILVSALSITIVSNATIVADSITKRNIDSVKTYDNSVLLVKTVADEVSKHTSNSTSSIIGIAVLVIITSIPSIIHYINSRKK